MDSPDDPSIGLWLDQLGLGRYRDLFAAQEIDSETLAEVNEQDLEGWGIPFGPRKRLARAIAALRQERLPPQAAEPHPEPPTDAHQGVDKAGVQGGERRQVTVMFCDMVGSSRLATRHDPEDVREVMRAYRDICSAVIARFEGFVVRYFGDGVLACFGWPTAHEDDAERAVQAGQMIVQEMRRSQPLPGITPSVRVGIATGLTVVGDLIGEGASQETSLVGETPNLAAQLQNFAPPDTVIIAAGTRRLLGNLFNLIEIGPLLLKESAGPVTAWQVVGEAVIHSRFAAVRSASPSDLIGRATEMALLLDRWQQARHGDGQVVLLSGQAGIGKSSLVEALRERVEDHPHKLERLQCSSYHRNSTLYPVIALIQQAAGINAEDKPAERLDKLAAMLGASGATLLPMYADLLSLPTKDLAPPLEADPQARKLAVLGALTERLRWNARSRPVLLLIEDAHWIDPTTRELIDRILPMIAGLPILLVVTFRPNDDSVWNDHPCITRLHLNRLGRRSCATMVERLAGGKTLPPAVLDAILAKTDGVPLFVEELTKMLLESPQLRQAGDSFVLNQPLPQLAVPTTLQDSLMARLDRLGQVKQIAQIGAMIGREFPYPLMAALVPLDEAQLSAALAQLAAAELITARGTPPDATYTFKHALVQDAAYASLLRSHRQQWHGRIAEALLDRMPALAQAQPEVMGRHYAEAGMSSQAAEWLRRAGERAIRRSADIEAIGHMRRALELLATLPHDAERDARELDVRAAISGSLFATQGYSSTEAGENCQRAYELCQAVGSAPRLFPTLWGRFSNFLVRAEIPAAIEEARRFETLALLQDDPALLAMAHRNLGVVFLSAGEPATARGHLDQAAALMRPEDRTDYTFAYGLDPLVTLLSARALVLLQLGDRDAAEITAAEALREARSSRHFASLAYALMRVGLFLMLSDQPDALTAIAAELWSSANARNARTWQLYGDILGGWCQARGGGLDGGIARMEHGITGIHGFNGNMFISLIRFEQAALLLADRQTDAALTCLDAAWPMVEHGGQRIGAGEFHRLRAVALYQHGGPPAAIGRALSLADDVAQATQARFFADRVVQTRAALASEGVSV
jgi:class 3 adenylate cyclase/tetratricopeptide (TPR) repeat protein